MSSFEEEPCTSAEALARDRRLAAARDRSPLRRSPSPPAARSTPRRSPSSPNASPSPMETSGEMEQSDPKENDVEEKVVRLWIVLFDFSTSEWYELLQQWRRELFARDVPRDLFLQYHLLFEEHITRYHQLKLSRDHLRQGSSAVQSLLREQIFFNMDLTRRAQADFNRELELENLLAFSPPTSPDSGVGCPTPPVTPPASPPPNVVEYVAPFSPAPSF